jgi:alkyl hydroperoxide reductase subunit AhpC
MYAPTRAVGTRPGHVYEQGREDYRAGMQNQAGAAQSAATTKAVYPIVADMDQHVAEQYGVFDLLTDVTRGKATPAVFVIDPSGHVRWSYIAKKIDDRSSDQTIMEHLPS